MSRKLRMRRRAHFVRRVRERISKEVDGMVLWDVLIKQMVNPDGRYLQFVARLSRSGIRLWRFWLGERWHFMVFDHENNHPITILTPDQVVPRQGRATISLEQYT